MLKDRQLGGQVLLDEAHDEINLPQCFLLNQHRVLVDHDELAVRGGVLVLLFWVGRRHNLRW